MKIYVIQVLTSVGWYRMNVYEDLHRALELAEHFQKIDGRSYRVVEYQYRDVIITL